jgi:hypothetical protein
MTTIDLVPVRTQLIKTFNFLAEKAKLVENLKTLSSFPIAYTYLDKTSVRKQALEDYVTEEYKIPDDRVVTALKDLENKGIIKIHQVNLLNERANYVQLTKKALYPTDKELENLFSVRV